MQPAAVSSNRIDAALIRLILVMVTGGVLAIFSATIINVGIRTLGEEFNASLSTVEWVSTGYLLSVAMAIPIAGWALERFGARRIWIFALSVFLIGSVLSALAWNMTSLVVFRVLQGIGGGMLEPIMLAVIIQAAGPARMARVLAIMSLPMNFGPVLGPIIGGLILEDLSWEWMFLVNVPIGLLALALAFRMLPRDQGLSANPPRFDVRGVMLLSPGFAAITYGLSEAGLNGFGSRNTLLGLAAGAALMAAYVVHALRTKVAPVIDVRLFRSGGFSASIVVMSLVGALIYSGMFVLPLFYQELRDRGVLGAGLLLAPLGIGFAFGFPLAGQLNDRVGARRLVAAGAFVALAGLFSFTRADAGTSQALLIATTIVAGFGIAFAALPTLNSVYRTVPVASVPSATGAIFIVMQLGASFGIAVTALVLQRRSDAGVHTTDSFNAAFWALLAAAGIVFVASALLPGRAGAAAPPAVVGHGAPATASVEDVALDTAAD